MELFTMHFRSFYELDTHHGIKFWKLNSLLLCQVNAKDNSKLHICLTSYKNRDVHSEFWRLKFSFTFMKTVVIKQL